MEWKNINDNYHVKYEDYFIVKNNVLQINTDNYYLKEYKARFLKQLKEGLIYNNFYEPDINLYELILIICPQPKIKVAELYNLQINDIIQTDKKQSENEIHFISISNNLGGKCQICKIDRDYSEIIMKKNSNEIQHYKVTLNLICLDRSVFDE